MKLHTLLTWLDRSEETLDPKSSSVFFTILSLEEQALPHRMANWKTNRPENGQNECSDVNIASLEKGITNMMDSEKILCSY